MAKSDLLKEAIADAKAVKETALANAKIALQEAFAPRLERMLATKLTNEIEGDEEEVDATIDDAGMEPGMEPEMDAEMSVDEPVADDEAGIDVGDLSIDVDQDGEFDEFDIMSQDLGGDEEVPAEEEMGEEEMNDEFNEELNLEAIIRELEEDLDAEMPADELETEGMYSEEDEYPADEEAHDVATESIDEIIEAILREEEEMGAKEEKTVEEAEDSEKAEMKANLEEAYATVKQLQGILSEVNLLNAKLLYTNKLFRNFELSENQKMKVIENFDRAGNTREVKLVFTTLAESFNRPTKKRVVKESYASKPAASTAPSKESTQVLSEGFELANRWKKLAGLL
jgi:hypothetical protein